MATTHELSALGHVIKPAYEGMADTNAFTDAEKAKLTGIEAQATKNGSDAELRDRATHTGVQTAATIVDLPDVIAGKVDAVPGKVLSDTNFTAAEKAKLAGLEDAHFKGVHVGLSGLEDTHPTGQAGDYAVVDDGVDLTWYQWSATEWVARTGESAEITPAQVKAYYESNPDTNAYADAHRAFVTDMLANNRFTWRRRGTWNAATNTPQLLDGSGSPGDYYVATTAGTQNFGTGDYTFFVGDFVLFEGGTWKRMAMVDSVKSVNGKNGTVTLNASDVGARSSSWTPSWADVTGKPDFEDIYSPKRVLIHQRTFNSANTESFSILGGGYAAYDHVEVEFYSLSGSTGTNSLHCQIRDGSGSWRSSGYVCRTTGNLDPTTQSTTAFTIIPEGMGQVLCNGILTLRKNGLPIVACSTYASNYRNSYGRMPNDTYDTIRLYFNSNSGAPYITGGTVKVYGVLR